MQQRVKAIIIFLFPNNPGSNCVIVKDLHGNDSVRWGGWWFDDSDGIPFGDDGGSDKDNGNGVIMV